MPLADEEVNWTMQISSGWADIEDDDLHDEVLSIKTERQLYREHLLFGPGMIYDIELNQERIYEG